jgi:hypothetical protein
MSGEEPIAPFADRAEMTQICDALWEGAYLFACFVQDGPMVGPVTKRLAPGGEAVSFAYYNTLGGPYGWRQRHSLLEDLNASLRTQVTECVIESDVHYGFTVRRILAKLHPDFFRQLVASGSYRLGEELSSYNENINSVVRELCRRRKVATAFPLSAIFSTSSPRSRCYRWTGPNAALTRFP